MMSQCEQRKIPLGSGLWVLVLLGCWVQAGTIRGRVAIEGPQSMIAVGDMVVMAEDGRGHRFFSVTDADGQFEIKGLERGYYRVWLEESKGFNVETPICGFYYEYLEDNLNLNYFGHPTGVMVDFGDPSGSGGFAPLVESSFTFSVYLTGLAALQPDYVEMAGYWVAPGQGPLDSDVVSGWPAGAYASSSMTVGFLNLPGYSAKYTMALASGMTADGETASYTVGLTAAASAKLDAAEGKLAFCGDYLRLWYRGTLLYDSSMNWNGNRRNFGGLSTRPRRLNLRR